MRSPSALAAASSHSRVNRSASSGTNEVYLAVAVSLSSESYRTCSMVCSPNTPA